MVFLKIPSVSFTQSLVSHLTDRNISKTRLYPTPADKKNIAGYIADNFITISPGSVWFTKTVPAYKWIELIQKYKNDSPETVIYLLGSKAESGLGDEIISKSGHGKITNLAGKLSFLESTALMEKAVMNFVNGFGPLSDNSRIVETDLKLNCRPCGIHGYRSCPMTHFKCAHSIEVNKIFYSKK